MASKLSSSGMAAVRAAAERHVAADDVPGLVALVASGDQVHAEALGRLSIGGPPVARDSLFRIASITKPVVAAAGHAGAGGRGAGRTGRDRRPAAA